MPYSFLSCLKPAWWGHYQHEDLIHDLIAGIVVALMLIPQGLAYATLAGVPPVYGLYSSILPLICYAFLGTSSVLSVGPVAITSLLTASTLAHLGIVDVGEYIAAAGMLALISGAFLLLAGLLRLGALSQLLSHPVVSSFVTGAAALIIMNQFKPLLGLEYDARSTLPILNAVLNSFASINWLSTLLGGAAIAFLLLSRRHAVKLLLKIRVPSGIAVTTQRMMPMLVLLVGAGLVYTFDWTHQLHVVGSIPPGFPALSIPTWHPGWIHDLWLPALFIGLLGFVESISIAQAFAHKSRPVDSNAELRALGVANMASAVSSGYPVTGGFSRTLVNAEAGARSPLSGMFSAMIVIVSLWLLTELFAYLPLTLLAAIIVSAAVQLISLDKFKQTWRYDRLESAAMLTTTLSVLLFGVEIGVSVGILMSLTTVVWRSSRPHIAVVGRIRGTEHFRNIQRYDVETHPEILMIRIDENLFFANAQPAYEQIMDTLNKQQQVQNLVLLMSSVSRIDMTALEMLEELNEELNERDIKLHLAEVKGPVTDRLTHSKFHGALSGNIFLSCHEAFETLSGQR